MTSQPKHNKTLSLPVSLSHTHNLLSDATASFITQDLDL